jgi:hypothetical protein
VHDRVGDAAASAAAAAAAAVAAIHFRWNLDSRLSAPSSFVTAEDYFS